jgi:glutamate 5-kinase
VFISSAVKRIVVKVGTTTITHSNGKLNLRKIDNIAKVLSDLHNKGMEVILVTSGAIGVGAAKLNLSERPSEIRIKQAAAAVGQCELMNIYGKVFSEYSNIVAQVLLTSDVITDDHRRENVINTFNTLFEMSTIPIVNENDTVSVEELIFESNDILSAIVAKLIDSDLLIILSDIKGLYDCDPKRNPNAKLIPVVDYIDQKIYNMAQGVGSDLGTGGMESKLNAAKLVMESGIPMIIADGSNPNLIYDILEGKSTGTLFYKSK